MTWEEFDMSDSEHFCICGHDLQRHGPRCWFDHCKCEHFEEVRK